MTVPRLTTSAHALRWQRCVETARRTVRVAAVSACALMGVACNEDPVNGDAGERLRMLATWQQQGLVYYTVEARIVCYCPPEMNAWHELTVSSDSIVAVRRIDAEPGGQTAQPAWFATVDEVYRRMETWGVGQRGFSMRAQYDAATGLPTRVELITSPNIADGGATYEFRALKPGLTGQDHRR